MNTTAEQAPITWAEVTEARFWEMLEILPPRFQAGYGFLVGEPNTHRVCAIGSDLRAAYSAFYETAGRYFEASGPLTCAEFQAVKVADVLAGVSQPGGVISKGLPPYDEVDRRMVDSIFLEVERVLAERGASDTDITAEFISRGLQRLSGDESRQNLRAKAMALVDSWLDGLFLTLGRLRS